LLLDEFNKALISERLSQSFQLFLSQFKHWNDFAHKKGVSATFYEHIVVLFKRFDVYLDDFFKPKVTSEEQLRLLDRLNFFKYLFDLKKK
jgi:hypothetical protein